MNRSIQFVSSESASEPAVPVNQSAFGGRYRDLRFTEGFGKSIIKFKDAEEMDKDGIKTTKTSIRLLPAITGAKSGSFIHQYAAVEWDGFKAVSESGDCFEQANAWLKANFPDLLADKAKNPKGFSLFRRNKAVAWAIYWAGGKPHLGLLDTGYSAKGSSLLTSIAAEARKKELDPVSGAETAIYPRGIDSPEDGRIITITKTWDTKIQQKQFGVSYSVAVGTSSSELAPILAQIQDEEYSILRPLDQVLHIPTEDEQKAALKGYLGNKYFALIFEQ